MPVTRGRFIVYQTGFALNLISFLLYFTGFASPYWVQSWPRIHSGFKRIGLWEACFAGNVLPFDPTERSYHGCWWIFAPEYQPIRKWLMPWWFILTQVICVIVFMLMLINLILQVVLLIRISMTDSTGAKKRPPIRTVQAVTVITIINAISLVVAVVLFGVAQYIDRNWMPQKQLNYLSWSYGLTICAAFFSIFATFAHIVYNRIVREDYRQPGTMMTPLAPPAFSQPSYS